MKNLIYLLLAMPLFLASCNNEEVTLCDEEVQVSFSAELPDQFLGRASSDLNVNKVVCAVFNGTNEIESLRETITITDASNIVYAPRLIKGRSYNVVFWAMKGDNYNVSDMKSISRAVNGSDNESDYDAFTASTQIDVKESGTVSVTLTRPLAQLNMGISQEDWNALTNNFGLTPKCCSISYTANDTFNALTGEAIGNDVTVIRSSSATGNGITVDNTEYKHIGTFYMLLAESEKQSLDIKYTVKANDNSDIRSNVEINTVPVQRNYKTNIVGGLLTGTVTYQITIENGFNTSEHKKEI